MPRFTSGTLVAGIVTAALATVCGLTAAATGSAPAGRYSAGHGAAGASDGACRHAGLPADCGSGMRVVYSVSRHRVWLVRNDERVLRSYEVTAGDPPPALGTHQVFARGARGQGGDGAPVEHVVLFAQTGGSNIGFSAAVGRARKGHTAEPTPAIRETRPDGAALWQFATIGTTVEVVE
ncbi:L,D-transpeptidase [Actinacidiphila acidipaludis]|uniref:L,D-transpeptidase n=1 Tax=Actinacidiphila acidipaludis TaxID=2873382 RepID=A0ABS7QJ64_9ACTN|nr:L,D-transpeptidase [Streptomyces acidipaludis]MBY8881819.1 L,D-transpeptidase [Streptomyces acidipaludis]